MAQASNNEGSVAGRSQTTREQAIGMMLEIARGRQEKVLGDFRSLRVLKKVLANSGGAEVMDPYELEREPRMDFWRVFATIVLVLGLIASVIWAIAQADHGAGGETRAQYISLVSGLAGIAIGWLFGSTNSGGRRVTELSKPLTGRGGDGGPPPADPTDPSPRAPEAGRHETGRGDDDPRPSVPDAAAIAGNEQT
jgi:hypothetical protein